MFACIPLLLIAMVPLAMHIIGNKQGKYYSELELTKGQGVIDHYYTDHGYKCYYVRFQADGKTYTQEVVGKHPQKTGYNPGVTVPIGYHINKKGIPIVFIDDEYLPRNKGYSKNNFFLYASLVIMGITVIYAVKTLMGY